MPGERFVVEFASEGAKFVFNDNGMRGKLRRGPQQTMRAAMATAQSCAPEVENYMKMNAPWQDQTGNARSGLFARPFQEGETVGIDLGGSVDYQIWLEVRWSGRYAIIQPTIDAMAPVVMRRYERMLDRMQF